MCFIIDCVLYFFFKLIMVSVQNLYQLCHKPPSLLVCYIYFNNSWYILCWNLKILYTCIYVLCILTPVIWTIPMNPSFGSHNCFPFAKCMSTSKFYLHACIYYGCAHYWFWQYPYYYSCGSHIPFVKCQ